MSPDVSALCSRRVPRSYLRVALIVCDDPCRQQGRKRLFAIPQEVAQHLTAVLAIERRWVKGLLGLREFEHTSNDGDRAGRRMLHLRQHLARVGLWMRQHITEPLNRRGGDGGALQQL